MRVERCDEPGEEWDAFATAREGTALGHAAGWKRTLEQGYRLETRFLVAHAGDGRLRGLLPLARVPQLRGGSEWVSLPYLDSGGVLAAEPDAERALVDAALQLVRESGARALELRQCQPLATRPAPVATDRIDLVLELESDAEAQWSALRAKVRNQTRKAERSGLVLAAADADPLEGFYAPFCVNMRDLGSPVHGRGYFEAMRAAFGPRLRIVVTELEGRPVGGLVAIRFGDTVTVPWASTLRSERARCPNNQIYWEALREAAESGARRFDFGRSPRDAGTYRFKKGWGASERELAWLRLAPDGAPLPPAPPGSSGLLRRGSELWQRLPLGLANRLGPPLRRRLSA